MSSIFLFAGSMWPSSYLSVLVGEIFLSILGLPCIICIYDLHGARVRDYHNWISLSGRRNMAIHQKNPLCSGFPTIMDPPTNFNSDIVLSVEVE